MRPYLHTVDTIPLVLWSCAELALINIAACIPTLRPLYLWLTGKKPQGSNTKPSTADRSPYGISGRRFGRFAHRSAGATQLESSRSIYQLRTYNVSFKDREDDQSGTEAGIGPTVAIHAY